jgi:hypothetical protein
MSNASLNFIPPGFRTLLTLNTKEKGTAYYLLTFDRDAWTGPRTYGNIHWYEAEEFAKGFWEY